MIAHSPQNQTPRAVADLDLPGEPACPARGPATAHPRHRRGIVCGGGAGRGGAGLYRTLHYATAIPAPSTNAVLSASTEGGLLPPNLGWCA